MDRKLKIVYIQSHIILIYSLDETAHTLYFVNTACTVARFVSDCKNNDLSNMKGVFQISRIGFKARKQNYSKNHCNIIGSMR